MNEELFRKKSMESLKSPDDLNEYVRVSSPGVWLLLVSILALLAGACLWGFLGHIDSTVEVSVLVEDGEMLCLAGAEELSRAEPGMTVRFADVEATVESVAADGVCVLAAEEAAADGVYAGKLVVESIRPASLVFG